MGVSVANVQVKIAGTKIEEQGPLLITHWGMSGPVILRLSAWGARELEERIGNLESVLTGFLIIMNINLGEKIQSLRFELASQKILIRIHLACPAFVGIFIGSVGMNNENSVGRICLLKNKIN